MQNIIIPSKMQPQNPSILKFQPKPFKNTRIYFIHKATHNKQQHFIKLFNQTILDKYSLNDALEFNIEVLTESPSFTYPENFLHVLSTQNQDQAVILMTKTYQFRLDQFLTSKGPQTEKNALVIFQDIIKAVYCLFKEGFWHRNLRAEHFVKSGNKWKLESIVYEEKIGASGLDCEYLFNSEYQPPQAYERPNFTDEELDQRIVWDLGCILIHLLLGSHKLKNQAVLEKFKNEPFSFKKIGAKIEEKLSSQLKQLLGQMCHYNEKKRIKIMDLISNGFFSKEVAQHYTKNKEKKHKVWVGSGSSLSQTMIFKKNEKSVVETEDALRISKGLQNLNDKRDGLLSSNGGRIETKEEFMNTLEQIVEEDENSMASILKREQNLERPPSYEEISILNNKEVNSIIDIYKNYLDKGEILGIGGNLFKAMLDLFTDKKLGKELVDLTEYAVNYVKTMDICVLAKEMNENRPFFDFKKGSWEAFHGSNQYHALKKIVNFNKRVSTKFLQALREKLTRDQNRFIKDKYKIHAFVHKYQPEQTKFADIKQPYRKILKLSYDMIAEHYTNNKTVQWARLGMYIMYCLAIDKFYIPEEFQSNFSYFFTGMGREPSNYVSLYDFQRYLEQAPREELVQYSRYIMKKYYQI